MGVLESSVKERITEFIKHLGISVRRFERECGLSYGYVNNMRVSIQPDKLMSISKQFPQLNTGWLMTGEGEMLRENSAETPQHVDFSALMELIKSQQKVIENLSDTVKNLTDHK